MSEATALPQGKGWPVALGCAVLFGLLIWFALPGMVVAIDDDFWYLKSLVETYQRGRPWTTEYLAPWAASTSSIGALIFAVTNSMSLAVHGQLAVEAGLLALGLMLWLRDRGASVGLRLSVPWLLLGVPTVVFMLLMFTGVALYWACFWLCAWAFGRRNWVLFFICWAVALANRQSAIVWLALPGWLVLEESWKKRDWRPMAVILAAGAWFLFVKLGMNANTAQAWVSGRSFDVSKAGIRPISFGLCVAALFAGLGLGGLIRPHWAAFKPWRAVVLMAAGAGVALWCLPNLQWTHSGYNDAFQKAYFVMWGVLAGLGLSMGWRRPWGGALLAALGCCALLTLYSGQFDYYFAEMVWWGVMASVLGSPAVPAVAGSRWWKAVLWLLMAAIMMLNARFFVRLKLDQHRVMAFNVLYEKAYREGALKLHDTGLSNMGHLGWWLEDYYREKTGAKPGDLAGFIKLCDSWDGQTGVSLVTEFPKSFRKYSDWIPQRNSKLLQKPEVREVGSMKLRILGFWEATYRLKQIPVPAPRRQMEIDYATFKGRPFPLNDAEWSRLMRGE